MRIAICDDDARCRHEVLSIVNEYVSESEKEFTVTVYEYAFSLLDDVQRFGGFDIYILDIIMPGVNGINLGTEIRRTDSWGKIIYLTSSREYAIDAFKTKASDYLLKPVNKNELVSALNEIINTISIRKEKSIIVKTKESNIKLSLDDILYAELVNRRVSYHLVSGVGVEGITIRTAFPDAVNELLDDSRFVLCGSSVAVNLYYVTMVETDTLFFKNGTKLYIGKRAGRELRSVWADFWMNGEEIK